MDVRPLSQGFGAEILALDLGEPLSDEIVAELVAELYEHRVLCIRDQRLEPAELERFGARFGTPIHHVEEDLRFDGVPGVMSLSNADGRPERQRNGGAFWHTDLIFTDEPASITMLNAIAVPATGGETNFSDQYAAYDALPAETRSRIDGLVVAHCYEGRTDGSMPTVHHPLVRTHPATGRKTLYGATGTCLGIRDMAEDEGRRLLADLGRHAVLPEFVYCHNYALGDLVMWDNAATLHRGPRLDPAVGQSDARIMHRTSVRGWPTPGPTR